MGAVYLTHSNVIIDYFNGRLNHRGRLYLESVEPEISVISQIEILSGKSASAAEIDLLKQFVSIAKVYEVNSIIADKTVYLRLNYNIKLADALIAATAL